MIKNEDQKSYSIRTSHGTRIRRNRVQLKPAAPQPTHHLQPTASPPSEGTTSNATPLLDSTQQACVNPQDQPAAPASRSSQQTQQRDPARPCTQKPHEEQTQAQNQTLAPKEPSCTPLKQTRTGRIIKPPRKNGRLCRKLDSLYTVTMNT